MKYYVLGVGRTNQRAYGGAVQKPEHVRNLFGPSSQSVWSEPAYQTRGEPPRAGRGGPPRPEPCRPQPVRPQAVKNYPDNYSSRFDTKPSFSEGFHDYRGGHGGSRRRGGEYNSYSNPVTRGGYFSNSRGNPPKRNEFPSTRGVYNLQVGSDGDIPPGNGNGSQTTSGSHGSYRGGYGPARGDFSSNRGGYISERSVNASFSTYGPSSRTTNKNGLVSGGSFNPTSRSTSVPTRGGYAPMRGGYTRGRAGYANTRGLPSGRGGQVPDERSFRYSDQFRKNGYEKRPNEPVAGYPGRGNGSSAGYAGQQYMNIGTEAGSLSSRPRRFNNNDLTPKQSNKENTPKYREISAKNEERLNEPATQDYPYSGSEMFQIFCQ